MEVGEHCSYPPCKRLDFLPFPCDGCKKMFCQEHRLQEHHQCTSVPEQPECHENRNESLSQLCSVPGCGRVGIVEVVCKDCKHIFCLGHRHGNDHNCSAVTMASKPAHKEPAMKQTAKVVKPKKEIKCTPLSIKVALMRLKQKAEGQSSIPESERAYFEVTLSREYQAIAKPLYISKVWTIGKAVDYMAQKYRLRNDNDKAGAQKLCLFVKDKDEVLPMRLTVNDLLETTPQGSSLYLEYT